jgi:hypothetical protein
MCHTSRHTGTIILVHETPAYYCRLSTALMHTLCTTYHCIGRYTHIEDNTQWLTRGSGVHESLTSHSSVHMARGKSNITRTPITVHYSVSTGCGCRGYMACTSIKHLPNPVYVCTTSPPLVSCVLPTAFRKENICVHDTVQQWLNSLQREYGPFARKRDRNTRPRKPRP